MESTLPQAASTVLINTSLAWTVGVLASMCWLRIRTAAWQEAAIRHLHPAMTLGLTTCMVGVLLSLWTESAAMGDVPWLEAWPAFKAMLISTHYGHAGFAATVILLIALLVHWQFSRTGADVRYVGAMTILIFLVAVARVTIGHAFAHGPWSIAVWAEWLHLLAMSLWVGAVFVSAWVVLPRILATEALPSKVRATYLASMSGWATAALAMILLTGAYNLYRVLTSPRDLLETNYGHILVFKLICVAIAIALGGFNRFFGVPAALSSNTSSAKAQRGLRIVTAVLRIESLALLLALATAAMMTSSAPPGMNGSGT